MDKIIYKGLGDKISFKKHVFIVHYQSGKVDIIPISKKLFNVFTQLNFATEG